MLKQYNPKAQNALEKWSEVFYKAKKREQPFLELLPREGKEKQEIRFKEKNVCFHVMKVI